MDASYHIVERVFSAGEMRDALRHLSSASLDRTRAGARHVLRVPVVSQLAGDARMLSLARQCVGDGAVPFRATLFDKSPQANWLVLWHQDTALPLQRRVQAEEWAPWSTKGGVLYAHAPAWALEQVVALRVSLDDSSRDNGPLRVLPNTHTRGVLSDDEIEILARERLPVDCVAASGGVSRCVRLRCTLRRRRRRVNRGACCISSTPLHWISAPASSWRLPDRR